MSTDLYGVRVLDVDRDQRRLRLRVFVVYYDSGYESHQPLPSDRSFFVRVLCDKDALGDDIAGDDRFDEAYIDANAFRFVDRFEELERRNHPVADWSRFSDFYYERDGGWVNEDELVQADYDVFVTRPEYTEAFTEGDSWGTTAYETDADDLALADYPHLPDFTDVRSFTPFPDGSGEHTVATKLLFSANGEHLLVGDGDGGFGVFRVVDLERVSRVVEAGDWQLNPGWTADGRVACWDGAAWQAWTLEGVGPTALDRPFGVAGDPAGQRFVLWPADDAVKIADVDGTVLYEREGAPELVISAAWDQARATCALGVEQQPVRIIDVETGETTELPGFDHSGLGLSPDGEYLAVASGRDVEVRRARTGQLLRSSTFPSGYATGVAWSPDGTVVATTATDDQGTNSRVYFHRIGRVVDAERDAPLAAPPPRAGGLADVARLYLARTADFSRGWESHLDDDKHDMHLALVRQGLEVDLVPTISQPHMQVAARAYESQLRQARGDEPGARDALSDALRRLEFDDADGSIGDWAATYVYAPLAAAHQLLGDTEAAAAALERARANLGDEANAFQKRAILCRALLAMGRTDEARVVATEAEVSWVNDFHLRLLSDLIDRAEWGLLSELWNAWSCEDEWDAREMIAARASELADPAALVAAVGADGVENDDDDDTLPESPDGLEGQERLRWFARRGNWDEVYAQLTATRQTLRNELWSAALETATERRDVHVVLDALGRLPCGDMNSPGLRALQATFRALAGASYRPWHP